MSEPLTEPREKEITTEEMLDTLEHCRANMALSEMRAYAGRWTGRDERTIDAIRRLIEAVGAWQKRAASVMDDLNTPDSSGALLEDIRNSGKKKEVPNE